jgi:hypothetical protein
LQRAIGHASRRAPKPARAAQRGAARGRGGRRGSHTTTIDSAARRFLMSIFCCMKPGARNVPYCGPKAPPRGKRLDLIEE